MPRVRGTKCRANPLASGTEGPRRQTRGTAGYFLADHQCLAIAQDVICGHASYLVGHSTKATIVNKRSGKRTTEECSSTGFASKQCSIRYTIIHTGNCIQGIVEPAVCLLVVLYVC